MDSENSNCNSTSLPSPGYTRWSHNDIPNASSDDYNPWTSSTLPMELLNSPITTTEKPHKIKISLSQNQINGKPPSATRPSAIPKRSNASRPSAVLYQSMSFQSSNSLRQPSSLPVRNNYAITPSRSPTARVASLPRKFSAPTITASTCTMSVGGSSTPGSGIAAASSSIKSSPAATCGGNKFIEDKYKCTLCCNPFSDPRVLDCLHTFCFACLSKVSVGGLGVVAGDGMLSTDGPGVGDTIDVVSSETSHNTTGGNVSKSHSIASSIGKLVDPVRNKGLTKLPMVLLLRNPKTKSIIKKVHTENPTSIICPICKVSTVVPVGGLPQNFVAKRRVNEALQNLGRELNTVTTVWCTLCYNETQAVAYCLVCNINLCNFCHDAHSRQRTTSLHDIRGMKSLRTSYQQLTADGTANKVVKCSIHPTLELTLFCTSCHQVACSNCTILLHRGHKCDPIIRASKVYVKMVKSILDRTKPLTDYANEAIQKMNTHTIAMSRRADAVQTEVDKFLDQYVAALEAHRRTLHTQIGRARESQMKSISVHQSELTTRCADAQTTIQFAEDLLATGHDTEVLTFFSAMLHRLGQCQHLRDFLEPPSTNPLTFMPDIRAPFTVDQNHIPMYGIIVTQMAVPRFCSIDYDGSIQLRVHRKVELTMTSRDAEDRQLCHGGLSVEVALTYRDVSAKAISTEVADRRDGTYGISFTPSTAGTIVMTVMLNGEHVKGSPFSMEVRSLRPHPGIFHCCSFCSSKGSKAAVCACRSVMAGGYQGCGHGHEGHPGRRHWSCCGSDQETAECSATNTFRK